VRDGVGAAGRALALGQGCIHGGYSRGQRGVVLGADGDEQLFGRGGLVRRQAHVGGELEVERGRHRDDHAGHPGQRGDGAAHLHEADRVGVDTGTERDGSNALGDGSDWGER
jgi:hypothetical protein